MSIIDKKGRLFGKLNIIDLIAILLIVAVVALLGYKLAGNQDDLAGTGQPVVYTVKVEDVDAEVCAFIQAEVDKGPVQLTASGAMLNAYVTAVEAAPVEETTIRLQDVPYLDAAVLDRKEAGTCDLIFTVEGEVSNDVKSELGTQEIRVGRTHIVKTPTFELENGVILTCERTEPVAE